MPSPSATPSLLDSLPLHSLRADFVAALEQSPVVLSAPTGSGKSTLAPLWCAAAERRTLVIEPRRVACRALYRFLAAHSGLRVGYAVRHERQDPDAQVLFVTPGVATRLLASGEVARFDAVVVDELHERRMDVDLLLSLLREQRARPGRALDLVVMSATLDTARVARWLGAAQLEGKARTYPVERHHLGDVDVPSARGLDGRVVTGVRQALKLAADGDVLVFLPGKGEIRDAERALGAALPNPVLPLHAALPKREQDRVFEPSDARRVILATNVAESSVTIPSVRAVVDSGLERRTSYRQARSVLSLAPISAQSATQRAGRAGRVAPGVAVQLWSAGGILRPDTPPEIQREDLDPLVLMAGHLGRRLGELDLLDPPEGPALEAALARLSRMGLVDETGALTPRGHRAARLPVDPLLAALCLAALESAAPELRADVVDLVATLAVGQPFTFRGDGTSPLAPKKHGFSGLTPNHRASRRCKERRQFAVSHDYVPTRHPNGYGQPIVSPPPAPEPTGGREGKRGGGRGGSRGGSQGGGRGGGREGGREGGRGDKGGGDQSAGQPSPPSASLAESPEEGAPGCDATLRIQALRGLAPTSLTTRRGPLQEARRIAQQLRRELDVPDPGRRVAVDHLALAALVLQADPGAAFVRRRTRFAGTGPELELARESVVDPDAEALVVLDTRAQRARGLRAIHQACCAIPVTRRWLARQGIGEERVDTVRLEGQRLVGTLRQELAGVPIGEREEDLAGPHAIAGAARLIARGSHFREVLPELTLRLRVLQSYFAHLGEPPPAPLELEPWLAHRLHELGMREPTDLALVSPEDLLPDLVPANELESFAEAFPPSVTLPDRRCDAEYDFASREVVLVHRSGNHRQPPPASMLPRRWTGWKVYYRVHSRQYQIK